MQVFADLRTGKTTEVEHRLMVAHGRDPLVIWIGEREADADTPSRDYVDDGNRMFAALFGSLPTGTFNRVIVEYLRHYRKHDAKRHYEPERIDRSLLDVIVALGEKFTDGEGHEPTIYGG